MNIFVEGNVSVLKHFFLYFNYINISFIIVELIIWIVDTGIVLLLINYCFSSLYLATDRFLDDQQMFLYVNKFL